MARPNRPDQMRRSGPAVATGPATQEAPARRRAAPAPGNASKAASKMEGGEQYRKEMFSHIEQRMWVIKSAQRREANAMDDDSMREHWRELSDSHKPEFSKPDARRWHKVSKMYRNAAHAFARGDLRRGTGLLRQAEQAEQQAFEQISAVVSTKGLEMLPETPSEAPAGIGPTVSHSHVPERIRNIANAVESLRPWAGDMSAKLLDEREEVAVVEKADEEEGNKSDTKKPKTS